ncbi:hypothetical protein YC2023_067352 [Brassica napus]
MSTRKNWHVKNIVEEPTVVEEVNEQFPERRRTATQAKWLGDKGGFNVVVQGLSQRSRDAKCLGFLVIYLVIYIAVHLLLRRLQRTVFIAIVVADVYVTIVHNFFIV